MKKKTLIYLTYKRLYQLTSFTINDSYNILLKFNSEYDRKYFDKLLQSELCPIVTITIHDLIYKIEIQNILPFKHDNTIGAYLYKSITCFNAKINYGNTNQLNYIETLQKENKI